VQLLFKRFAGVSATIFLLTSAVQQPSEAVAQRTAATAASVVGQSSQAVAVVTRPYSSFFRRGQYDDVGDIKLDDLSRRIFISFRRADLVEVFTYSGAFVGALTISQPGQMTALGGSLYVLSERAGEVVRVNPETLQTSTPVTGLISPRGLSSTSGFLYTVARFPAGDVNAQSYLAKLDPTLGNITPLTQISGTTDFWDPSPLAENVYFSSRYLDTALGFWKADVRSSSIVELRGEFICYGQLRSGQVLLGNVYPLGTFSTFDPASLIPGMESWVLSSTEAAVACGSGGDLIALVYATYGEVGFTIRRIDQRSMQEISQVAVASEVPQRRLTRVSSDGSCMVVTAVDGEAFQFHIYAEPVARRAAPNSGQSPNNPRKPAV
jgi:hypothetical protein